MRLFIYLGFFARRGRELYTVGALDKATDLDVLAIRYAPPFRSEVQIAECKGGGEGPLDRIFWLSGVRNFVSAAQATLIRRSTKWNIKDFAKEAGVEIIDLPRLDELERSIGIDAASWPGASDRDFLLAREVDWNRALHRDDAAAELYLTLVSEARFHDPFGGINFLLHHARALTRILKDKRANSESLAKFLLCESVSQLAMFLMRVAESSFGLAVDDRAGFIRKGLTYGHMDARLTERIFRNAYRITTETLKHYTGSEVSVDESFFKMPTPPSMKEIQEIVELLVRQPIAATTFAPITDLLIFDAYLKQKNNLACLDKIFPYTDLQQRVQIVRRYFETLHRIDAVPEALIRSIEFEANGAQAQQQETPGAETRKGTPSDPEAEISAEKKPSLFDLGQPPKDKQH